MVPEGRTRGGGPILRPHGPFPTNTREMSEKGCLPLFDLPLKGHSPRTAREIRRGGVPFSAPSVQPKNSVSSNKARQGFIAKGGK